MWSLIGTASTVFPESWQVFPSQQWRRAVEPAGIILCMSPTNERWHYIVTSSLIGWAHTQNHSWTRQKKKLPPRLPRVTICSNIWWSKNYIKCKCKQSGNTFHRLGLGKFHEKIHKFPHIANTGFTNHPYFGTWKTPQGIKDHFKTLSFRRHTTVKVYALVHQDLHEFSRV